jgi:hypothetical protein
MLICAVGKHPQFEYLGTTLTDQNCMHMEMKSSLISRNACYHSVQSLMSSCLLSRNVKLKIILPVVLSVHETWSLTLREQHSLKPFENKVLVGIFGPNSHEVTGEWRNFAQWGAS